jgi:glycosyltransferase involved in cell wall biosynthesis
MKASSVEYTVVSGDSSEKEIKKIDPLFAKKDINEGGIRWELIENKWLLKAKFLWQKNLINIALSNKYDSFVFLGSPYFITTWIAAFIVRLKGKKVYYWMHGVYRENLTPVDYLKLFVFYKIANGFFLYGNRAAGILRKYNVRGNKDIHIIYNSLAYEENLLLRRNLETSDILNFRHEQFQDRNTPIVVFIGRLNDVKRLDLLLHAQDILRKKHGKPFFNCIIVGDGKEADSLKLIGETLGLSGNLIFKGAIYDEAINAELLMHSDLCVTPGEIGLTAIHSLAYGTPTISHDNLNIQMPEVESIKPGINGDLFKHNDVGSLADSIEKWLTIHPVKTAKVMSECYHVIDQYYNPKFQAKIFNEVLSKR